MHIKTIAFRPPSEVVWARFIHVFLVSSLAVEPHTDHD